ncbi:MAG TPA: serine hydrolase [Candidatus Saccharimonadales bacterium]|nr:serine hydrolase [Candidatus Saccharimonadales bacterium]
MARRRTSLKKYWAIILLAFVLAITAYIYWPDNGLNNTNTATERSVSSNQAKKQQPSFPVIDLQPTVDAWVAKQSGRVSIVIYDLANKKTVASLNPDRQYFTASIYKLYVAYIGYQKIADGTYNASEPYLSGYNRTECLDAMIRNSYSPCGEKWWNELGKDSLTAKLKTYSLKNTSMTGLYTSANDAAIILQRLFERRDLTEAHTKVFLDSMKDQPVTYRRGLPSGFSQSAVYNKVGWNLQIEWHDTAIVTLPNGRSYVITVLTQNVGSAQIAALGKAIETRLTQ